MFVTGTLSWVWWELRSKEKWETSSETCTGHKRNKNQQGRLLLNLEHLSFFSSKTLIISCTKYQLEGCMSEALRPSTTTAGLYRRGQWRLHSHTWWDLSAPVKGGKKPVGAPLYQKTEHPQVWKSSEATHLHTVVQKNSTWDEIRSEVKTSICSKTRSWNSNWTGGAFVSISAETCAKKVKRRKVTRPGVGLWLFLSKTNLKNRFESCLMLVPVHRVGLALLWVHLRLFDYSLTLVPDCHRLHLHKVTNNHVL